MLKTTVTPPCITDLSPKKTRYLKALDKACRDFEGIFLKQVVSTMRTGTLGKSLFGEDVATQVVTEMHDSALADSLGQSGGIGLGKVLYEQLSRQIITAPDASEKERSPAPVPGGAVT